ncbi:MAG: MFS transporter [Methylophilaceae bacterium]|nr:MFS transporter [Methylophilaceae bacterium]
MQQRLDRWLLFQYAILAFPVAFAGLPLYIHAPDFYTNQLGLSLGLIGTILLIVRLLDAIQDPLIGYWSDRYSAQRSDILISGTLLLTTGLGAIFFGPQWSISTAVWFAVSMMLATTGFSVVVINLNMIGGFWTSDQDERTRIAGWRESFTLFGLLVASILPSVLLGYTDTEHAFEWLFWVYMLAMLAAWMFFSQFLKRVDLSHLVGINRAIKPPFFQIFYDKQRLFFFIFLLAQLAASLPAVLIIFFVRDYLQAEAYIGLFLFLYFVAGAALMPLWFFLSKKLDKYRAWLLSMTLSVGVFSWVAMLSPGDAVSYGVICVLSGFALGADLALPASIIADRINASQAETRATQYYGVMAFIPKLALALASGCAFLILDRTGFAVASVNSETALQALLLLYGLLPCIMKLLAAICLWMLINSQGDNDETIQKRSNNYGAYDVS